MFIFGAPIVLFICDILIEIEKEENFSGKVCSYSAVWLF
jgi:hypothetical protein